MRDLSEEEEIAGVEREEDEEEITFGSAVGVVFGLTFRWRWVGIGVMFGWLNEIGVCSPWVWVCRCGSGIYSPWVCCHGFESMGLFLGG